MGAKPSKSSVLNANTVKAIYKNILVVSVVSMQNLNQAELELNKPQNQWQDGL